MESFVNRRVVLNQSPEYSRLYGWCLQEIDTNGNKVGSDQIPWGRSLYFTASELELSESLAFETNDQHESEGEKVSVCKRGVIRGKLHPGHPNSRKRYRETAYSMFGTDRSISDFQLCIEMLDGGDKREGCEVWGGVSYTSEIDFREEIVDDAIVVNFYLRPETFARYAELIVASAADEVIIYLSRVSGFYSEWSPSISTYDIKVLTGKEVLGDDAHKVEIPTDCEIDPPRIGKVNEAEIRFLSYRKLEGPEPETSKEVEKLTGNCELSEGLIDGASQMHSNQQLAVADTQAVGFLSAIRIALWVIAGLLLLILITLQYL